MMNYAAWHEVKKGFHPSRPPQKKTKPWEKKSKDVSHQKMIRFFGGGSYFGSLFPSQALRKLQLKSVDDEVGQFFFSLFLVLFLDQFKSKCGVLGRFKICFRRKHTMMCHIYMYINYWHSFLLQSRDNISGFITFLCGYVNLSVVEVEKTYRITYRLGWLIDDRFVLFWCPLISHTLI